MEYSNQLNKEQYKAVTTNSKRVLAASSAGSGKTKVLTTRIKYLLDNGVSPNEIIAFTFTKRAAKEMIYRLNNKFNNIYTFHSYSYKMLLNAKDDLGFNQFDSIRIETEEYELYILNDIINELNIKYSPKSLMQFITKSKNNLEYKFKTTDEARIYNQVYYKFQEYMMQRGEIDFDDMISLFLNNIDNISFKDSILNQCKYILVDEFQDTNQIQYELLKKLSSKYNNLFCVGDINQLIYSFRSSDVRIINEF
jgi:DNA helicase-2/ATP-dependent DNA helicase PcrA